VALCLRMDDRQCFAEYQVTPWFELSFSLFIRFLKEAAFNDFIQKLKMTKD
jgi:hypothetical protein